VGKYDLVEQALKDAGLKLLFHRICVKPGKPILAGRCGDCLVFGLPGNPVSTFVGFEVFVAPALRKMMGYRHWGNVELPAVLEEPLKTHPGRVTYHLSRVTATSDGLTVRRVRSKGSGDALSMTAANAFAITGAEVDFVEAGSTLPVLLFRDFHLR
jgi:molybdopterin molybdotransferase